MGLAACQAWARWCIVEEQESNCIKAPDIITGNKSSETVLECVWSLMVVDAPGHT